MCAEQAATVAGPLNMLYEPLWRLADLTSYPPGVGLWLPSLGSGGTCQGPRICC